MQNSPVFRIRPDPFILDFRVRFNELDPDKKNSQNHKKKITFYKNFIIFLPSIHNKNRP